MKNFESSTIIGPLTEEEALSLISENDIDTGLYQHYFNIDISHIKKMYSIIRGYQIYEQLEEPNSLQTALNASKPRLENTLRRLKTKGIYQENTFALFDSIAEEEYFPAWLWFLCGQHKYKHESDIPDVISDETWYIAIEELVRKYSPEMLADPNCTNYFFLLKGHETELQLTAFVIHCMDIERFAKNKKSENTAPATPDASIRRDLKKLQKKCDAAIAETKRATSERNALKSQIAELKKQLSDEKLSHGKELLRIEHDHEDERDAWEAERARLLRHIARLENPNRGNTTDGENSDAIEAAADGDIISLEDTSDEASDADNIELPESGVIFLGGHSGVIQKVKALHPGWMFFNLNEYRTPNFPQNAKVAFYHYEHTSHKVGEMFYARVGRDVPLVYLKATNIAQMEREMKRGYAKVTG